MQYEYVITLSSASGKPIEHRIAGAQLRHSPSMSEDGGMLFVLSGKRKVMFACPAAAVLTAIAVPKPPRLQIVTK